MRAPDQRVIEAHAMEEISLGDYVLSGGELAALAVLDATVRLLPGVMGALDSAAEESFTGFLLEYPHYTRPAEWQGFAGVPDVLLSGHPCGRSQPGARFGRPKRITRERRPDLNGRFTRASGRVTPIAGLASRPRAKAREGPYR